MATGNYGTIRPADVSVDDVEIFYSYTLNRESINSVDLIPLDPQTVLIPASDPNNVSEILGGLYTLKLPTSVFGSKGFYTIIIRPKQIRTTIQDCGVLSGNKDVKGLVFNINDISLGLQDRFENGNLVGYRIEYLKENSGSGQDKIQNLFRIVTSNNRVLPITQTQGNSSASTSYAFNDNSTSVFCTLTPSSAPSIKPNATPFIGNPSQRVIITNTFFDPVMLEIEMVEYDDETLAYALLSNQTKSLDDGIYTIYNFGNEIYKQYNLYEVKNQFNGKPLYEVREEKFTIDPTKDFDDITNLDT
ncbi:MAG: hypothetical protein ACW980_20160 [Promethearchaeota archaeon]|mgnify:FL=1|jgi:hypothetical protein|tara:strand:+ start:3399 stop:4307 length:909 start_codon:yes stop_codon:yes gene_type:complete